MLPCQPAPEARNNLAQPAGLSAAKGEGWVHKSANPKRRRCGTLVSQGNISLSDFARMSTELTSLCTRIDGECRYAGRVQFSLA